MDIRSIVRAFRYGQLQSKAVHDPEAKQPPTIKFLAITLFVGVVALGFGLLVMNYEPTGDGGTPLSEPNTPLPTNNTTVSPTPTVAPDEPSPTQSGPTDGQAMRRTDP